MKPTSVFSVGRQFATVALVFSLAVAPLGRLQAQTPGPRDPRETEAKKACLSGKWERGIELLADLYAESGDPTYIYNQGRCFQQNGRGNDAVTRFREYLRKATDASAADRAQVEGFIKELEGAGGASAAEAGPTPASGAAPETAALAASSAEADSRRRLRLAGVATAGLGVLLIGGGIVMGARTKTFSDEVTKAAAMGKFDQSKYDAGRQAETLQWVGLGVGAAAVVAGGILVLVGGREPTETARATALVAPMMGASVFGGTLRVTF